jgi:ubiquitin carboxyl-terminal hydrolase 7
VSFVLYILTIYTTQIITDETFTKYEGFDLASFEEKAGETPAYLSYRTKKDDTLESFKNALCENLGVPSDHIRLWILVNRQNRTVRPDAPILDADYQLSNYILASLFYLHSQYH